MCEYWHTLIVSFFMKLEFQILSMSDFQWKAEDFVYYVMSLQILFKSCFNWLPHTQSNRDRRTYQLFIARRSRSLGSLQPPLTHESEGIPLYYGTGFGTLTVHTASTDITVVGRSLSNTAWWKMSWLSERPSPTTVQWEWK